MDIAEITILLLGIFAGAAIIQAWDRWLEHRRYMKAQDQEEVCDEAEAMTFAPPPPPRPQHYDDIDGEEWKKGSDYRPPWEDRDNE